MEPVERRDPERTLEESTPETGRTYRQIEMAPRAAFFVTHTVTRARTQRFANNLGRGDLKVIALEDLNKLCGVERPIVIDHAVELALSPEQRAVIEDHRRWFSNRHLPVMN